MRINEIVIEGFRGFNGRRIITLDSSLTLIYAPNSYGKTSISESLEWLLYGSTSKVRRAEFKDEYKGSYRNVHFSTDDNPIVSIACVHNGENYKLEAELLEKDIIQRRLNHIEVENWEEIINPDLAQKPFIVQHDLKELLLVKPSERFTKFASLLGFDELDSIQKDIVDFCTKPEGSFSVEAKRLLAEKELLLEKMGTNEHLTDVSVVVNSKNNTVENILKAVSECAVVKLKELGRPDIDQTSFNLTELSEEINTARLELEKRVFKGSISIGEEFLVDIETFETNQEYLAAVVASELLPAATRLAELRTADELTHRAELLGLGLNLIQEKPDECPLCGQELTQPIRDHIQVEHKELQESLGDDSIIKERVTTLTSLFESVEQTLQTTSGQIIEALKGLDELDDDDIQTIQQLLGSEGDSHAESIVVAKAELDQLLPSLKSVDDMCRTELERMRLAVKTAPVKEDEYTELGSKLIDIASKSSGIRTVIESHKDVLRDASVVLSTRIASEAGTEQLNLLQEVLSCSKDLQTAENIEMLQAGLKELRSSTVQFVSEKILELITGSLSDQVDEWYGMLRTEGDPDVHFDGFDIERTKSGTLKARRIDIRARSYDQSLPSAVSSLSESKLNALGLCISIAVNNEPENPFEFLVIDDPIQSWDVEHETKFIEILRSLMSEGKQLVVLSHNHPWVLKLRKGLRSISGKYLEITGYNQDGPIITELPWDTWENRLNEVDAIAKDLSADSDKIQRAEQDLRHVITELVSDVCESVTGRKTNPSNINKTKARKMLLESGAEDSMVDRISLMLESIDDAHHSGDEYQPNREKLSQYLSYAHELRNWVKGIG